VSAIEAASGTDSRKSAGTAASAERPASAETAGGDPVLDLRGPPAVRGPLRQVEGLDVPIVGRWVIDPGHSSIAFESRHATITRMRGRFRAFRGDIVIAQRPADSSVDVVIEAASIDTVNAAADDALRGEHFLHVVEHPELRFRSTRVTHTGGSRWLVDGDLTIRGITRPVRLDATFEGAVAMPGDRPPRLGFCARTVFDRRDYGIELNFPLPGGGWLAAHTVGVELDIEAQLS
jgi:polyisoprenoid-binding protein YceI